MNLSKCKNGHFYDVSIYQSCPHCSMSGDSKTIMAEGDFLSPDMFPRSNVPHPPIPPIGNSMPGQMNQMAPGGQPMPGQINQATPGRQPMSGQMNQVAPGRQPMPGQMSQTTPGRQPMSGQMNQMAPKIPAMPGMPPVPPTPPGNLSYQRQVAPSEPKQVSVAPGMDSLKDDIKFPVGFAVCVSGENRGDSYKLKEYNNYLGRKSENDICLDKDISVSRMKHANIYYSPETKEFWIMPGESKEAIHLRTADSAGCTMSGPGKLIQDRCKLNAYDEIVIGKSVIKFVPLCGIGFSW